MVDYPHIECRRTSRIELQTERGSKVSNWRLEQIFVENVSRCKITTPPLRRDDHATCKKMNPSGVTSTITTSSSIFLNRVSVIAKTSHVCSTRYSFIRRALLHTKRTFGNATLRNGASCGVAGEILRYARFALLTLCCRHTIAELWPMSCYPKNWLSSVTCTV